MATLSEWRGRIENEVDFVDIKPYSHNIIGICLSAIAKGWGKEEADKAIKDFNLEELGWRRKDD